jgi:diadenosine tetraphosphate (Ap4A) HIT family hydrolase
MEMLLAWGCPPSHFKALPKEDRDVMWVHWKWRNERQRIMQKVEEMKQKAAAMQKGRQTR